MRTRMFYLPASTAASKHTVMVLHYDCSSSSIVQRRRFVPPLPGGRGLATRLAIGRGAQRNGTLRHGMICSFDIWARSRKSMERHACGRQRIDRVNTKTSLHSSTLGNEPLPRCLCLRGLGGENGIETVATPYRRLHEDMMMNQLRRCRCQAWVL